PDQFIDYNMANGIDIANLTDPNLNDYLSYLQGSTPASLADRLQKTISILPAEFIKKFVNVCLLAATTQRRVVDEYLAKPENAIVYAYIKKNWFVNDKINFSNLNLIGHCIMAASGPTNHPFVSAFRNKMAGALSIWHANIPISSFSIEQKKIFSEKVASIKMEEAVAYGATMGKVIENAIGKPMEK
ncbi:hypothetical protein, partial [Acinetobacter pittii]|uniref:hypothetical protein n=1 Tax=Acinetobacter pittii TaxID=48296 RepID=UPI001A912F35